MPAKKRGGARKGAERKPATKEAKVVDAKKKGTWGGARAGQKRKAEPVTTTAVPVRLLDKAGSEAKTRKATLIAVLAEWLEKGSS